MKISPSFCKKEKFKCEYGCFECTYCIKPACVLNVYIGIRKKLVIVAFVEKG